MSFGSNGVERVLSLQKTRLHLRICALMALVRQALHRLSCTNEMVRNASKHEFWVHWSGSGAFVSKNFEQLRLANLCVNGTNSASFASTFV
jgi:hypothetical protein